MLIRREFVMQVVAVGADDDARGLAVTFSGLIEHPRRNFPLLFPLGEKGDSAAVVATQELGQRLYQNVKVTVLIEDASPSSPTTRTPGERTP